MGDAIAMCEASIILGFDYCETCAKAMVAGYKDAVCSIHAAPQTRNGQGKEVTV
jgi:hypothetical protein